ncbi:DegT/DnrJ/EryC1/StrS family aminotransferase [Arthrobacter sunyaminii]|uniref:DegT/DnrJ/EryC1/StrS family aminotransferase n=1 Tax=Arthrobacter sunyaminii TaxID=2816859 RepID=A0A975XM63_9MICC|nr:DegT/DnrJ/EryC1/StrS family aminotransferase [Arthrobacter sunyaminii]MBO0906785.1 DegT/DnrJ/EryC1/StrS family aminotransferase [Arthrobacter sunyaminii]QWQ37554.1 DegT/DnrJ/EryC1/StrS family aminotransferase [Arthrobacter sunyaminii]
MKIFGTPIPFVDLAAQHAEVDAEVQLGLKEVFAEATFIGGRAVAEFEMAYARMVGSAYCIGAANGTDALELALRASGVTAGGEVILPANTFIATAEAVSRIGAVPVLVDVDPVHLLVDPEHVAAAAGPRTQAIVPVHLFGQMAPMELLAPIAARWDAALVEDAAQAQGALRHGQGAGAVGVVSGTSFYPGKNLGAAGDAGAVTTNNAPVAETVRLMANHGSRQKYQHDVIGMNSRLDTIQAVVLNAKLGRLARWNALRRDAAAYYTQALAGVPDVVLPAADEGNFHVWHLYVIRIPNRDRVLKHLHAVGVHAGIHYPIPVHLTGAYTGMNLARGSFPQTERAAEQMLSLPLHPHITREQQDYVVNALVSALATTR